MNPFSSDLKDILLDKGIGNSDPTKDWSIHLGGLPSEPVQAYGLVDIPGEGPQYLTDETTIEKPMVQLLARSFDYTVPHTKLSEARDAVALIEHYEHEGALYWVVLQETSIQFLTKDENSRFVWVVNLRSWRTKV